MLSETKRKSNIRSKATMNCDSEASVFKVRDTESLEEAQMRFLPLLDNKDYHQRNKRQQKEVFQT
jgi:hypothetical protein